MVSIKFFLLYLVVGVVQSRKFGIQGLDTDLDDVSLSCINSRTASNKIIDIHHSMERGAKLLDGVYSSTLDGCLTQCCAINDCDLTLYKNIGLSKSGKNCYFIKCGDFDNCVMVTHGLFTSVMVFKNANDDGANKFSTTVVHAPVTMTTTTENSLPTSTESDLVATTTATPTPSEEVTTPTHPVETTPSITTPSIATVESGVNEHAPSKSKAPPPPAAESNVEAANVDSCGMYGCDGSGIIAVVIIGVICFITVVIVAGFLIRRIIKERKKKKFRNVDYLINGMYT